MEVLDGTQGDRDVAATVDIFPFSPQIAHAWSTKYSMGVFLFVGWFFGLFFKMLSHLGKTPVTGSSVEET